MKKINELNAGVSLRRLSQARLMQDLFKGFLITPHILVDFDDMGAVFLNFS